MLPDVAVGGYAEPAPGSFAGRSLVRADIVRGAQLSAKLPTQHGRARRAGGCHQLGLSVFARALTRFQYADS